MESSFLDEFTGFLRTEPPVRPGDSDDDCLIVEPVTANKGMWFFSTFFIS